MMKPRMIKINDKIYDDEGNEMTIKDIWISNFHLSSPTTYIKYDYFTTDGESGTESTPLSVFINNFFK